MGGGGTIQLPFFYFKNMADNNKTQKEIDVDSENIKNKDNSESNTAVSNTNSTSNSSEIVYQIREEYKPWTDAIPGVDNTKKQALTGKQGEVNWRTNNPGNIIAGGTFKSNSIGEEIGKDENHKYLVFKTPVDGMKALYDLLSIYWKGGDNTVKSIITKYAPEVDNNNTNQYIQSVCKELGVNEDDVLPDLSTNKNTAMALAKAITMVESPKSYDYWEKEVPGLFEKAWSVHSQSPMSSGNSDINKQKQFIDNEKTKLEYKVQELSLKKQMLELEEQERLINSKYEELRKQQEQSAHTISDDPQQEKVYDYFANDRDKNITRTQEEYEQRREDNIRNGKYYSRNMYNSAQNDILNYVDKDEFNNHVNANMSNYFQGLINRGVISSKYVDGIKKAFENLRANNGLEFTDDSLSELEREQAKNMWDHFMSHFVIKDDPRQTFGLTEFISASFTGKEDSPIHEIINSDMFRYGSDKFKQELLYSTMKYMRKIAVNLSDEEFYSRYKFNKNDMIKTRYDAQALTDVIDISPDYISMVDRMNWARLNFAYNEPVYKNRDRFSVHPNINYGLFPNTDSSGSLSSRVGTIQAGSGNGYKEETGNDTGLNVEINTRFNPYEEDKKLLVNDDTELLIDSEEFMEKLQSWIEEHGYELNQTKTGEIRLDYKSNKTKAGKTNGEVAFIQTLNSISRNNDSNTLSNVVGAFADFLILGDNYNGAFTPLVKNNAEKKIGGFIDENFIYDISKKDDKAYNYALYLLLRPNNSEKNILLSNRVLAEKSLFNNDANISVINTDNKTNKERSNRLFYVNNDNVIKIISLDDYKNNNHGIRNILNTDRIKQAAENWSLKNSGKL